MRYRLSGSRICKILCAVLLFLWGIVCTCTAKDFYRIGEDFRSLAMGGTGVTSANNSYTLFYNPAALANVFAGWIDFPMIQVSYSDDAVELYQTMATGLKLETQEERYEFMEATHQDGLPGGKIQLIRSTDQFFHLTIFGKPAETFLGEYQPVIDFDFIHTTGGGD